MVVMSHAIIDAFLFGSLEYIHLYNPRCRPDGEVVVLSHHILKRFLRSSLVIDFCSGHSLAHCLSTSCVIRSLDMSSMLHDPCSILSASAESAAQLRCRNQSKYRIDPQTQSDTILPNSYTVPLPLVLSSCHFD